MVLEEIPNHIFGVIYVIATTVGGLFLFRGAHTFYHNLKIYHKIPADYDAVVAYRGEPPGEQSVEDFVTSDELRQDAEADIREIEQLSENKDPEVVLDFEDGRRTIYGEPPFRKFVYLAFYFGVASLIPAAIVVSYYTLLSANFPLQENAFFGAIGVLIMIVSLHLGIRVATLAGFSTYSTKNLTEEFQGNLHNFAFSFFMSLYVLWAFTIVIIGFTRGLSSSTFAIQPRLVGTFAFLLIFLPILAAILSQYILRKATVSEHLSKDYMRTEEI